MRKIHYGWMVCAACVMMLFICSGMTISAFSVYMPYIQSEGGFTNTQTNIIVTFRSFFSMLAKVFTVWLIHRLDARRTAAIACTLVITAYLCFSLGAEGAYSGLAMYCAASALAGASNGIGTMISATILLKRWFITHMHLVIGLSAAGTGLATLLCPPVIALVVRSFGLRSAFLAAAAFIIACSVFIVSAIRNYPSDKGIRPYGETGSASPAESADPKTEHRRTQSAGISAFDMAVLCSAPMLIGAVGITCASIFPLHCTMEGVSPIAVSTALSVYGAALIAGKLVYGIGADIFGGMITNAVFLLFTVAGLVLSCFIRESGAALIGAVTGFGFGFAICTAGISSWVVDLVPPEMFDTAVGRFQVIYALGGLLFSLIPGPIADLTGSYIPVFIIYITMTLAVFAVIMRAYMKNK